MNRTEYIQSMKDKADVKAEKLIAELKQSGLSVWQFAIIKGKTSSRIYQIMQRYEKAHPAKEGG
jgi:ABC-type uncharacterized transport system substrate-binding protein